MPRPRRAARIAALTVAALILPALAAGCSQPAAAAHHHARAAHHATTTTGGGTTSSSSSSSTSTAATSTTTASSTVPALVTNPAGELPQTDALPSTDDPQFKTEMNDLWKGILTDSVTKAIWSFFPEAAYDKLKAISNPDYDWRYRLVAEFEEDLRAAHDYIFSSPGASSAELQYVAVAGNEVAWIPPGYCYNSIGYWHAPGVRLVYQQDGQQRSIGIASLISWRGEWYVVHLGAVLRSGYGGVVDDPSTGLGEFAPAGGC